MYDRDRTHESYSSLLPPARRVFSLSLPSTFPLWNARVSWFIICIGPLSLSLSLCTSLLENLWDFYLADHVQAPSYHAARSLTLPTATNFFSFLSHCRPFSLLFFFTTGSWSVCSLYRSLKYIDWSSGTK